MASVGPYALRITRPRENRSTSSGGHASPATTSCTPPGIGRSAGHADRTVGGRHTMVVPVRSTSSASGPPGPRSSAVDRIIVAPESSPMESSQVAASKLYEANWSQRVSGPMPMRGPWSATITATVRCSTTTPLGRPVEPEV